MKAPWPYKLMMIGVFCVAYFAFYVYPNFWPIFEPVLLPVLDFERRIPFIPWTVTFYTSDYLYMFSMLAFLTSRREFHEFSRLCLLVLFLGGPFFYLFPTMLERPVHAGGSSWLVEMLVQNMRDWDAPTNCFPSLHIGFTGVGLWCMRDKPPRLWSVYFVWACLITVSVLTTKQHYFWDILGGFGLILACIWTDRALLGNPTTGRWLRAWENTSWWKISLPPKR